MARICVCIMPHKLYRPHLQYLIGQLRQTHELIELSGEMILEQPIERWPCCDVLMSFYHKGLPFFKVHQYAELNKPFMINDFLLQYALLDRRIFKLVLQKLKIPTVNGFIINRGSDLAEDVLRLIKARFNITKTFKGFKEDELIETSSYIEYHGKRLSRPFVEKPANAEDHNIIVYYPDHIRMLFRKKNDRSSEIHAGFFGIRRTGSFVYEEFCMPNDHTDIKVYALGCEYTHAEARKAPIVDGIVERDALGKEKRQKSVLSEAECEYARRITLGFGQRVCGLDILRHNDLSYVIDVNGWSFVKTQHAYYDRCAAVINSAIQKHQSSSCNYSMRILKIVRIYRHADRTPKQKIKAKSSKAQYKRVYDCQEKNKFNSYQNSRINRHDKYKDVVPIEKVQTQDKKQKDMYCAEYAEERLAIDLDAVNSRNCFNNDFFIESSDEKKAISDFAMSSQGKILQNDTMSVATAISTELGALAHNQCKHPETPDISSITHISDLNNRFDMHKIDISSHPYVTTLDFPFPTRNPSPHAANSNDSNYDLFSQASDCSKMPSEEIVITENFESTLREFMAVRKSMEISEDIHDIFEILESRRKEKDMKLQIKLNEEYAEIILKWGGTLTHAGIWQSRELGETFRYLLTEKNEHLLKKVQITSSSEKRVVQSARIFAQGLLFEDNVVILENKELLGDTFHANDLIQAYRKSMKDDFDAIKTKEDESYFLRTLRNLDFDDCCEESSDMSNICQALKNLCKTYQNPLEESQFLKEINEDKSHVCISHTDSSYPEKITDDASLNNPRKSTESSKNTTPTINNSSDSHFCVQSSSTIDFINNDAQPDSNIDCVKNRIIRENPKHHLNLKGSSNSSFAFKYKINHLKRFYYATNADENYRVLSLNKNASFLWKHIRTHDKNIGAHTDNIIAHQKRKCSFEHTNAMMSYSSCQNNHLNQDFSKRFKHIRKLKRAKFTEHSIIKQKNANDSLAFLKNIDAARTSSCAKSTSEIYSFVVDQVISNNIDSLFTIPHDDDEKLRPDIEKTMYENFSQNRIDTPKGDFITVKETQENTSSYAIDKHVANTSYSSALTIKVDLKNHDSTNSDKEQNHKNKKKELQNIQSRYSQIISKMNKNNEMTYNCVSEIYNNFKYDITHNNDIIQKVFQPHDVFYNLLKKLSSFIIKNEYGKTHEDKLRISYKMTKKLFQKLIDDIQNSKNTMDVYFTKESRIYTLLNIFNSIAETKAEINEFDYGSFISLELLENNHIRVVVNRGAHFDLNLFGCTDARHRIPIYDNEVLFVMDLEKFLQRVRNIEQTYGQIEV